MNTSDENKSNDEIVKELYYKNPYRYRPIQGDDGLHYILEILKAKDLQTQQAVKLFRERIWSVAKPDFQSVKGGDDLYIIKKQDLNAIVEALTPKDITSDNA